MLVVRAAVGAAGECAAAIAEAVVGDDLDRVGGVDVAVVERGSEGELQAGEVGVHLGEGSGNFQGVVGSVEDRADGGAMARGRRVKSDVARPIIRKRQRCSAGIEQPNHRPDKIGGRIDIQVDISDGESAD